jgi:hypothetical protein
MIRIHESVFCTAVLTQRFYMVGFNQSTRKLFPTLQQLDIRFYDQGEKYYVRNTFELAFNVAMVQI